jgi:hypothetical protein
MTTTEAFTSAEAFAGLEPRGDTLKLVFSDGTQRTGRVEALDGAGRVSGSSTMDDVMSAIPCFTPGCALLTDRGPRQVAELAPGDRVATRDNGLRPILWIGERRFDWRALGLNPILRPILIRAGALGDGLPERDMTVSPNHRILFVVRTDGDGREEAFVQARDLTSRPGIAVAGVASVSYVQILFDRHEAVMSDGLWSESFQPQERSVAALGGAAAAVVTGIIGGLHSGDRPGYAPARISVPEGRTTTLAM